MRAFSTKKYPRRILVQDEHIVSVKVDDRGFVVHKWTKKIVDLKQVYLVVKDNRKIYQLALEFTPKYGEKKPFTDVLQFDPATSRSFTQLISSMRKELLNRSRGGPDSHSNSGGPQRFSEKYGAETVGASSRVDHGLDAEARAAQASAAGASSAFATAIANANQARAGAPEAAVAATGPDLLSGLDGGAFGGTPSAAAEPAFTPAAPSAASQDPFANPAASFNSAPAAPSPFDAPVTPPSSSGALADPFNVMMDSVNANGHQVTTLFTPPPSTGALADPFAAQPAPAAATSIADPFAASAAPAAANPFAAAAVPADPFAAQQAVPAAANPFAAAPQQQQVSNPFA